MNKQLSARLSSLEKLLEVQPEPDVDLSEDVAQTMRTILSYRKEWADRIRRFGDPRDWPENGEGRWDADTEEYDIVQDLFREWLGLPAGSAAIIAEPWNLGTTVSERVKCAYHRSYHGRDFDYSENLSELLAMRPRWVALRTKFGHPRKWPENAGRWRVDEHDGVIAMHLAIEWEEEWKRRYEPVGAGWFIVRNKPLSRPPDPAARTFEALHRVSPGEVT